MRRLLLWGLPLLTMLGLALLGYASQRERRHDDRVRKLLDELAVTPAPARLDCARFTAQKPLVLLALGQSNAGNHAEAGPGTAATVQVMNAGLCSDSADPLPGATGQGSSIWSRLPAGLASRGISRPVVLQVLAVNASTIDDWVRAEAPITRRLAATLQANSGAGLLPDLVLWQQGEADARVGTTVSRYTEQLLALAWALDAQGVQAPILLALSTVCRSAPDAALRGGIQALAASHPRFVLGPDTDTVQARHDGCHWSARGRDQVAGLWAQSIAAMPAARAASSTP